MSTRELGVVEENGARREAQDKGVDRSLTWAVPFRTP